MARIATLCPLPRYASAPGGMLGPFLQPARFASCLKPPADLPVRFQLQVASRRKRRWQSLVDVEPLRVGGVLFPLRGIGLEPIGLVRFAQQLCLALAMSINDVLQSIPKAFGEISLVHVGSLFCCESTIIVWICISNSILGMQLLGCLIFKQRAQFVHAESLCP